MNFIKNIFVSGLDIFRQLRLSVKIFLFIVLVFIFTGGAIIVTDQPGFCNSCHIMNTYYASWQKSSHSNVNCLDCHLQPGFSGFIKGKINGLAQAVDCIVGRVSTKPSATVFDKSCLRSECHDISELSSDTIDYNDVNFSHQNHINTVVDGMGISCGTCHSHFEGSEHISISKDACYTCHFLTDNKTKSRLVQTECRDCHEVPDTIIQSGLVTINHTEFVSYNASCEDSCHKKELQQVHDVANNVCLNCHSFTMDPQVSSEELHQAHTISEKVECFACHEQTLHGQTKVQSLSAMMDCQNCHSNTHQVQQTIFSSQQPITHQNTEKVLSPMFLTHVECTGCHIQPEQSRTGALDSLGIVAKAVPQACDNCHEEGTGQQYIPFWQGKIKELYEQISKKSDILEERAQAEENKQLSENLLQKVEQARLILESVSVDGSWGVHNFKYTEAMLLQANELLNQTQELN